jgi:N-acylneuraminate cytidylyltransferase
MTDYRSTLVVVPARGGSKRIPNKNIKEIFGQPMIYWPLSELSKLFTAENLLVSTDSEDIISAVESKGLKVPFKRPKSLSDEYTGIAEVLRHALEWYEKNVRKVRFVIAVYPTAVMLDKNDIRAAMETLKKDERCDYIMSATNFSFPIQRAVFENENGYAEMFEPKNYPVRSQDLVEAKHDAGQFSLFRAKNIRNSKLLTDSQVKLHILDRTKVIDIDTLEDFKIAEEKLRIYKTERIDNSWRFQKKIKSELNNNQKRTKKI